jgi:RibD C-terminal domain
VATGWVNETHRDVPRWDSVSAGIPPVERRIVRWPETGRDRGLNSQSVVPGSSPGGPIGKVPASRQVGSGYFAASLLDEMLITIVPLVLGGGARLFDNLGDTRPSLEQVEAVAAPGLTHVRYRVR